jgi:putative endonuclease
VAGSIPAGPTTHKSRIQMRDFFLEIDMSASCYILHSQSLDRFYVGVTTQNIEDRIQKHNHAQYGNHRYTATADDWELYLLIDVMDYSHAIRLERKIKSMKSSKYIKNLKVYPELLEKIIEETKSV